MIGIVPAAGAGQRIQPLGCAKELLPVGSRVVDGKECPKAVSEFLIERMIAAGATRICMVISPDKSDVMRYYAERSYPAEIFYVVQRRPRGLCDALFRAAPFVANEETVLIGLPDTIWFPENAYAPALAETEAAVNLVLFPTETPSVFDAVCCDGRDRVTSIEVKAAHPASNWVWGALTVAGKAFHELSHLWESRQRSDEYLGTLLNAYLEAGNTVCGHRSGQTYIDVGTMEGYRRALDLLLNTLASVPPEIDKAA